MVREIEFLSWKSQGKVMSMPNMCKLQGMMGKRQVIIPCLLSFRHDRGLRTSDQYEFVVTSFVNRYLMKCASQVQQGNTPPLSLSFLSRKPELCRVTRGEEFLDPQVQRKIYQDRTSQ